MKRLKGICTGRRGEESVRFECDEITVELDHDRTLTIRRESVGGEDCVALLAGISRNDRTSNARFVARPTNFGILHLSVEQAK